jgi:hypothetical protein
MMKVITPEDDFFSRDFERGMYTRTVVKVRKTLVGKSPKTHMTGWI